MRFAPSSLRHFPCADIISLNAMARPVLRLRHPLVLPVRCWTVAKVLSCSDVLPVLGREVIEGEQHIAVFGQLAYRFVVFHAVGRDKEVKSSRRIHVCFGLPNVMQMALCFGLN